MWSIMARGAWLIIYGMWEVEHKEDMGPGRPSRASLQLPTSSSQTRAPPIAQPVLGPCGQHRSLWVTLPIHTATSRSPPQCVACAQSLKAIEKKRPKEKNDADCQERKEVGFRAPVEPRAQHRQPALKITELPARNQKGCFSK